MELEASAGLSRFLRASREQILDRWEEAIRVHARAQTLTKEQLRNGMPKLVLELAEAIDRPERLIRELVTSTAAEHALHRLDRGYDLDAMISEVRALRSAIFDTLLDARVEQISTLELRALDRALDEAMVVAASTFSDARMRLLSELDRSLIVDGDQLFDRARFSSEVSTRLAQTLSVQETFEQIIHLAVPSIADWCAIDLLREDGRLGESVAVHHVDAGKIEALRQLRREYPPDPELPGGIYNVIRTGEPLLMPDIPEEVMARSARDERHLALMRSLGLKSGLAVPLAVRGENIGALSMAIATSGRRLSKKDLELAIELSHRASFALANAQLYERAQEEVRVRESILAIVSHDLKNPLGAIMMSAGVLHQLAIAGDGNRRIAEVASRIQRASDRMHRLISDLLDFASIQAGRLAIEPSVHDAAKILDDARESFALNAEESGIELLMRAAPELPPLFCDRDRIIQVLTNIISNAFKVTPHGGRVELNVRGDGAGFVQFSVRDTGPGVPESEQLRIFERYFRGEDTRYKGTGLGLAIAKGLVEAHAGRIWTEGVASGGACFAFTVPTTTVSATSNDRADPDRG